MNVQQMQKRWDEINEELEAIHDELTANGRPTEEAVAAAQAPLIAERKQLESEFAAMRRADAEVEKVREVGVAFFNEPSQSEIEWMYWQQGIAVGDIEPRA